MCVMNAWVMSHLWMSHVTHEWAVPHKKKLRKIERVRMCVMNMNAPCQTKMVWGKKNVLLSPPSLLPSHLPLPLCLLLSRGLSLAHDVCLRRRETDRQRDRQACRQTQRTNRQTDRQTDRQARADHLVPFASPKPSITSLTNLKHWHTVVVVVLITWVQWKLKMSKDSY